jgi:hypothetical protein
MVVREWPASLSHQKEVREIKMELPMASEISPNSNQIQKKKKKKRGKQNRLISSAEIV